MENVVLTVHLILALLLIGVVLLQRSEGGGLGMGSGGGAVSGRAAATALGKVTWILATGFVITSITMTVIAAQNASSSSVIDQIGAEQPAPAAPAAATNLGAVPTTLPASDTPAAPPAAPAAPAAP
jgi:preprotein translocase subunit SecG